MKTKTKIIIGGAITIVIAYFLFDRSKNKKLLLSEISSIADKKVTNPKPAIVPNKPMPTEVALNDSGVIPLVKDSFSENERQALAERETAERLRLLEQKRLASERAEIEERERIANQERLFLMEEEIRNKKNQSIRDTSGMNEQRFYDGVNNDFRRSYELYTI